MDLASSHHTVSSAGAWWNAIVFTFQSRIGTQLIYRRKHVVLTLANKEGGAHVDKDIHPDYARLLTDSPLSFTFAGTEVETPDLARLNTRRFALFLFPGSYSEINLPTICQLFGRSDTSTPWRYSTTRRLPRPPPAKREMTVGPAGRVAQNALLPGD